jgi:hypothetical protein
MGLHRTPAEGNGLRGWRLLFPRVVSVLCRAIHRANEPLNAAVRQATADTTVLSSASLGSAVDSRRSTVGDRSARLASA